MVRGVSTGEADKVGAGVGARPSNLDLGALHVELGGTADAGGVKGEQLDAHEVVAGGDAAGHVEVVPAAVGDHVVDSPDAVVEALLGDLEPLEAGRAGVGSIVDLGEVDLDGTLVGGGDGVIRVVGPGGTTNLMPPPGTDSGAGWDLDHGVIPQLDVGVAGKVGVVDVLDGEVAVGSADALELALVDAVNRHLLEDGVGADGRSQGDESEGLHCVCVWRILGMTETEQTSFGRCSERNKQMTRTGGGACRLQRQDSTFLTPRESTLLLYISSDVIPVWPCIEVCQVCNFVALSAGQPSGSVFREPILAIAQIGNGGILHDGSELDRLGTVQAAHPKPGPGAKENLG